MSERPGAGLLIGGRPLALGLSMVRSGGRVASTAVADPAAAHPGAQRGAGKPRTMRDARRRLDPTLEYGLSVSRDDRSFGYPGARALAPGIAASGLWQYPVREFAFGNVPPAGCLPRD